MTGKGRGRKEITNGRKKENGSDKFEGGGEGIVLEVVEGSGDGANVNGNNFNFAFCINKGFQNETENYLRSVPAESFQCVWVWIYFIRWCLSPK